MSLTTDNWKTLARVFWTAAIALFLAGCATCYFGVEYEIAMLPPEQKAGMTDFDWIGIEWVFRGMLIQFVGYLALLAGLFCAFRVRKSKFILYLGLSFAAVPFVLMAVFMVFQHRW